MERGKKRPVKTVEFRLGTRENKIGHRPVKGLWLPECHRNCQKMTIGRKSYGPWKEKVWEDKRASSRQHRWSKKRQVFNPKAFLTQRKGRNVKNVLSSKGGKLKHKAKSGFQIWHQIAAAMDHSSKMWCARCCRQDVRATSSISDSIQWNPHQLAGN